MTCVLIISVLFAGLETFAGLASDQQYRGLSSLRTSATTAPNVRRPDSLWHTVDSTKSSRKQNIVITRVLDAPVARAWRSWTDPQWVMRWWGPKDYTSPLCKIDFRVGGKYVFGMRAPKEQGGQDFYVSGVFKKIVRLKFIELTQALSDENGNIIEPVTMGMPPDFPKEVRTTLVFKAVGGKTELTVTEYDWPIGQMRDMSEAGLNQCLDKLAESLK